MYTRGASLFLLFFMADWAGTWETRVLWPSALYLEGSRRWPSWNKVTDDIWLGDGPSPEAAPWRFLWQLQTKAELEVLRNLALRLAPASRPAPGPTLASGRPTPGPGGHTSSSCFREPDRTCAHVFVYVNVQHHGSHGLFMTRLPSSLFSVALGSAGKDQNDTCALSVYSSSWFGGFFFPQRDNLPALVLTCLPASLSRKPFLNPVMAHLFSLHPGRQSPEPQRACLSLHALGLHAQSRSTPWIVCLCRRGWCGHQVGPRESLHSFRLRRGPPLAVLLQLLHTHQGETHTVTLGLARSARSLCFRGDTSSQSSMASCLARGQLQRPVPDFWPPSLCAHCLCPLLPGKGLI